MKYIHFLFFILIIGCLTVKAAPAIGSIGYTSFSCSSSLRTFTVNISDVSPIATGSLTPRVYYKINTGPYTSASGTLTSGTLNNGIWTFTMTYAVSSNDFVYFFVTAQNALGNIVANPSTGFVA
ncbi:MAG: hypothetical protein ABIP51_03985, partial [Bacteroidia bacterium]